MLHLIIGSAGTGKTHTVRKMLAEMAENGRDGLILLTPEQNTFESERAMLQILGAAVSERVEVLSFTRLVDRVERELGGFAGKIADDGARMIMMGKALKSVKDRLVIYKKSCGTPDFAKSMLDIITEFRQSVLTASDLLEIADRLPSGTLSAKTKDIAVIMAAYDALLANSYIDPQDSLTKLFYKLGDFSFFKGKGVFIDAFKGFTEQQYLILSRIIGQADEVYITFCTDRLDDNENGMGLFSNVKAAAARMVQTARDCGVGVAAPILLDRNYRFCAPELSAMEELIRGTLSEPYEQSCEHIKICVAQTVYDEADFVARTIRKLVRTNGLRYRDFAVIARDSSNYAGVIDSALERYDIPYFMDSRVEAEALPLMKLVLNAISVVNSGFSTDYILSYFKSPLSILDTQEISALENYAYIWRISGDGWHSEWTQNPDGFTDKLDEERLRWLNELREKAVLPLQKLQKGLAAGNVRAVCTAVYALLSDMEAAKKLRDYADDLDKAGEPALADIQRKSWDVLMSVFDQIVQSVSADYCPAREFYDLFKMIVASQNIGAIPSRLDEVIIGSADRIRPSEPKQVFILGANYREFPKPPSSSGLLTLRDRTKLIASGLKMPDRSETEAIEEKFLIYNALCCASDQVTILYHRCNLGGAAASKSDFVTKIEDGLKALIPMDEADSRIDKLESPMTAVELISGDPAQAAIYREPLKSYFEKNGEKRFFQMMTAIESAGKNEPKSLSPKEAVRLFGEKIKLSPSKIEVYHKCGFSYFCKYGIAAKMLRPADLDVMQKGTLVHYVLEKMVQKFGKNLAALEDAERRQEIDCFLSQYISEMMGGETEKTPRFLYLFGRIATLLDALIKHIGEELAQSGFVPADCELEISEHGKIKPVELPLMDGGSVSVSGIVDRVDVFEKDGKCYVRVIDYKTGAREFNLADVLYGLNMQMLIYLFTIRKNGGSRYGSAEPAGILYMPAQKPVVSVSKDALPEEIYKEHNKKLKMNGLLLNDENVLFAMEKNATGVYTPFSFTKSGLSSRSSVASMDDLNRIEGKINSLLTDMGERLHKGDIAVNPLDGTDSPACKYCDYRAVCLRDMSLECDTVKSEDLKSVLEKFAEQGGAAHGV